ncbi:MAG: helix-turn-helix transcriptional regulator [Acutalibacteraceae bacterium]|nr:helix-turn-helix transcriptional regulator [Acutalibacteraceae bacterium]
MGKISAKSNKSIYHITREELGWSREKASEELVTVSPERIERIENNKIAAHPDDILAMAKGYNSPHLCNYYCSNECPIGQQYVPEIKAKDLSQIVLEMIASLNSMKKNQEKLIEITADGVIEDDELEDFVNIQEELEKISITIETLQLWTEQMIAHKKINLQKYNELKNK